MAPALRGAGGRPGTARSRGAGTSGHPPSCGGRAWQGWRGCRGRPCRLSARTCLPAGRGLAAGPAGAGPAREDGRRLAARERECGGPARCQGSGLGERGGNVQRPGYGGREKWHSLGVGGWAAGRGNRPSGESGFCRNSVVGGALLLTDLISLPLPPATSLVLPTTRIQTYYARPPPGPPQPSLSTRLSWGFASASFCPF